MTLLDPFFDNFWIVNSYYLDYEFWIDDVSIHSKQNLSN